MTKTTPLSELPKYTPVLVFDASVENTHVRVVDGKRMIVVGSKESK